MLKLLDVDLDEFSGESLDKLKGSNGELGSIGISLPIASLIKMLGR